MKRVFDKAFWRGVAGAGVVALLLSVGWWGYQRYQEFVWMRGLLIKAVQQAAEQGK